MTARRITVLVQDRYTLEAEVVTGARIKELASIPAGFALHRRVQDGGNEPIGDDDSVEVHDGDHFFARPPSDRSHVR